MTDRKLFDIFYGAREGDHELCRRAYEAGCDINFAFDGRRATKGGAGRWYYGDLQWYAPDGINGDREDTLLIIAIKNNDRKLVEWILTLNGLDSTRKNGKCMDALEVAKTLGREHLLLGAETVVAPNANDTVAEESAAKGAADGSAADGHHAGAVSHSLLPCPPPTYTAAVDEGSEVVRLGYAVNMLKVSSNDKDQAIATAKKDCEAYQQIIKEKDASIGELRKEVLDKEKEVIGMLHKIGRLEEALAHFTDDRQADADQYSGWGQAGYYKAEADDCGGAVGDHAPQSEA